ncbi:galactose-1-phosphate uridylyltransferase [Streptomyces polyrhachis]|uniref:Galactose-1-phosphate uridylyltransferase n=1 Tax=Streptomyces polyrhachis TaxID=1282885 RepID=A0ABW2GLR0_9ACTN
MKKTSVRLADGRELIYYDAGEGAPVRDAVDRRSLPPAATSSQARFDPLLREWVVIASHRQGRTHLPPADECPLCPSREGRLSEIPAADYEVAVFENRFPSLTGAPAGLSGDGGALLPRMPGAGRCEVVCFTSDHHTSFADLSEERAALVLAAWTDRTAELSRLPGVEQVFCFENRGEEIGVTLGHPHGQIYAYPFTTPRTARMLDSVAAYGAAHPGANLFGELLAAERADGSRIVLDTAHWTAFVPHAAHWPYEVHLYPRQRAADLTELDDKAREEFPAVYLELLRRFDRIFDEGAGQPPTPYVAAWHQAPVHDVRRGEFALHLELFTVRRTAAKLKYLAGSESAMDVFVNDVPPEQAAARLREVASA